MTTNPDIEELIAAMKAGMEGVTDSPWSVDNHVQRPGDIGDSWAVFETMEDDPPIVLCQNWHQEANARHIARCSPDNIAALIDTYEAMKARAEAAEAKAAELMEALNRIASGETEVFDDDLGATVVVWMDEDDMAGIARNALAGKEEGR